MTKAADIRQEDIVRAIRAAKKMGLRTVRITVGKAVIEMPLTDDYLKKLSDGHLPAPSANDEGLDFKLKI